jgi:hypothetical protein
VALRDWKGLLYRIGDGASARSARGIRSFRASLGGVLGVGVVGWLRWVGRGVFLGSVLVAGGAAVNQLVTGDGRLSWTAAYFALVFTVLGVLLDQLPARVGGREGRTSRRGYLRRVRASVEQMETIGLVTQAEYVLRTRQVYVDVALQPRPVTETVPDGGVGGVPAAPAGVRKPLASFLTPGNVLAVLGAAGSGKTTMVRYTALQMAEQRRWPWQAGFWRPRRIPLLLYLRDHAQTILAEQPQNLAAIGAAAPWLEGAVTERWLQRRLGRGRCVVLLDGLDEVAGARERAAVVGWVNTQIRRYPGNTMVVTSRPLGYEANRVAQADVLQVQRFTHPQIAEFLSAWFQAIEHRARQGADPDRPDRGSRCRRPSPPDHRHACVAGSGRQSAAFDDDRQRAPLPRQPARQPCRPVRRDVPGAAAPPSGGQEPRRSPPGPGRAWRRRQGTPDEAAGLEDDAPASA